MTLARNVSSKATVIVTGGAGFIGSHTVDRLVAAGCRVIVVDNFSSGRMRNLRHWAKHPNVVVVCADIADGLFAPLDAVTNASGSVEGIIHLAAQTAVQRSLLNPLADIRVNCAGTAQVLEYARCKKVRAVVFASSAAVYGDDAPAPTSETAPQKPVSPYGINKLASEHFLRCYHVTHGLTTTAFRFFNVYGPRQDQNSYYSGVISIFARQALQNDTLTIFGDGQQTRDFIFVDDVARALVFTCLNISGDNGAINLGTGRETTIEALAHQLINLTGATSRIEWRPRRAGDIYRSVADISCAERRIGFRPATSLVEGLQQTLAWMANGDEAAVARNGMRSA